ncbi:TetR/AcrR family transcriptional regulator [Microbacteriaceae bacterium VKM Ac-2854]|nr:TetR/AcrR family transcriptional regulator [Microbacteriaceae bacterium VKM Ac-2854]
MTSPSPRSEQAEQTRTRILTAARTRFAERGFAATTVRTVASDAGIDPAMIIRYFGSKANLFAAASTVDLALTDFADVALGDLGTAIAGRFLDLWEPAETGDPLRVLLTSALRGSPAAERMRSVFAEQLRPAIRHAIAEDPETGGARAAMIASQLLGFALARYVIRLDPIVTMSRADAVAWLAPAVQSHLEHPRSR